MAQLDTTVDYRQRIEEYFARRPVSRSRRSSSERDGPTTADYRQRVEEYFARRPLSRSRRCSPSRRQAGRMPSRPPPALPIVVQTVQPAQQVQAIVHRIPNNQPEPEHRERPGFEDDARVRGNNDENIIDNRLIPNVSELRLEEVPQPLENNNQGVIPIAVRQVDTPPAPIRSAASPARVGSNAAPLRSPRSSMFLRDVMPTPTRPPIPATRYVPPPRPAPYNQPVEQPSVSSRAADPPDPATEDPYYPQHGYQSPYSRRPPNASANSVATPITPRSRKESNERLSREHERRMHQNFLAPAADTGIVPMICQSFRDVDGFLERHQRERIARPRFSKSSNVSSSTTDQSTWAEENVSGHRTPIPSPRAKHPTPLVDELLLNTDEPILASSGKPNIVQQAVPAKQFTRAAETTPRTAPVLPTACHIQKVPAPVQAPVPKVAPARVAPSTQPVGQRPLSKSLVPKRRSPQPPMKPQPTSKPQEPPLFFMHEDLEVRTVSSPRIAANTRKLPPRVSPPKPQSSSFTRPQSISKSSTNSFASSRNSSIPKATPRVPRMPLTSHAAKHSLAMQQKMQTQSQVLQTIQDLPMVGMHDITDVWGLQNDTTVAFEQTHNSSQPSPQQQPTSILARRVTDIPTKKVACSQEEERVPVDVSLLTPESLDGMTAEQLEDVVDAIYTGAPRNKYKQTYPYLAEGVVQKDGQLQNKLRVFSSRLGKVYIPDSPARGNNDYVYFIVAREGDYRGFAFHPHPSNLVSAKFGVGRDKDEVVIRGYAILGHASYRKSEPRAEERWVCWNDSMGMMNVLGGAAMISLKKHPVWDKQLDIVSISSIFENNCFVVKNVTALTNVEQKKKQFPEEVFLAQDMIYKTTVGDDYFFYSPELDITVSMRNTLVDRFNGDTKRKYEIVVGPTFPSSTRLEFKGILLIDNPMFWSKDKEWVREKLLKRTEAYKADSMAQKRGTPPSSVNSTGILKKTTGNRFSPRKK